MESINRPHQRKGATCNAHVGRDFEDVAKGYLARHGIVTQKGFKLPIGVGERRKRHGFDLGSSDTPVVVECKSHRWTEGDKVPSAKMAVWNEAMYCFSLVPKSVRRILFVLRHCRTSSGESLVDYYLRTHGHLAQSGVEIWEYDETASTHRVHIVD